MKNLRFFGYFSISLTLVVIIVLVHNYFYSVSVSPYIPIEPVARHSNGQGFAGSSACIECHKNIYLSHVETAHFKSSSPADSISMKGSFDKGSSISLNDEIRFKLTSNEDDFYQEAILNSDSSLIDSKRIDVVIGSGTKGQSYLNWDENALFQLQVSYFSPTQSWINSPGYPDDMLAPPRPIQGRCLECHVTYAENIPVFNKPNVYRRSQMIYGIDCERCHGPGAEHVNLHRQQPKTGEAMAIKSYNGLTQRQKLEACALCHSGIRRKTVENPFSFIIGDSLNNYSTRDYNETSLASLDVHGNQYGLLLASACFKNSPSLDCISCHNPHRDQRGQTDLFNAKCMQCHGTHSKDKCSLDSEKRNLIGNNCIRCHMPLTNSKTMTINNFEDSEVPVKIRTHYIGTYPLPRYLDSIIYKHNYTSQSD